MVHVVPADPQAVVTVKKKAQPSRSWVLLDSTGETTVLDVDKYAIMHRVNIHARDLRILDPLLSYPSTILGRDRAIVLNLEHIKAIITSEEVLLRDPSDEHVVPVVQELKRRLPPVNAFHQGQDYTGGQNDVEAADEDESPFEFRALEVALESICSFLAARTLELESAAYPALDELTSQISTRKCRQIRNGTSKFTGIGTYQYRKKNGTSSGTVLITLIPTPNLMENPVKTHKFKNYQKPKGMSFFAFLFSVVIYIYIFYIFSLSPSTLFSNTKFWFAISNTLILIIAADYGAFSSSKDQKRDLYEEYALHSQARRSSTAATSSFVSQYPEFVKKSIPNEEESLKEKKKEDEVKKMNEIPERILEVVKIEPETDNFQAKSQQEHLMKSVNEACDQAINQKKIEPKTILRRKSDKVKRVTFNDKKNNLKRSKTENHEPSAKENEFPAEENEFSTMSDEELNRRVEEFIQNFNREIRLQGAKNRQLLEYE